MSNAYFMEFHHIEKTFDVDFHDTVTLFRRNRH